MIQNQLDIMRNNFVKYLDSLGLSPKSHKNYRSDLNHFVAWSILKIRSYGSYVESLSEIIPFLSVKLAHAYKDYMTLNSIPDKTINRRLSTLRHLSKFLVMTQVIDADFMGQIENMTGPKARKSSVEPLIHEFRSYLEAERVSPNTIKNYLSDIKQFLTWLESNQRTQPTDH